ncbi:NADH-quinone oxidoreductase subunit H [Nocardioides donggukensis]|uniref:NADH-quinone oxidoreductase subunit H n=1 Tax=Nocardioides donggukensis TaxID=2774019 RepID=A0A927Q3A3_9ACTN|nr:NADH-quinone oxidoreductase subunit H [Nocardioides donggukensis]MBD8870406.1 NADH-quinone oxidoreductase subunit H [Nocardioides donggukensis]
MPDRIRSALLVPVAETARLLRQRPRRTVEADLLLWRIASSGLLPLAVLMLVLVPWGDRALVSDPVGVVWFNALDVFAWALVWLLGWGANAVYGLVGGYRFLALALGYELPLMFALIAPAVAAESLDLGVIAAAQSGLWYVVWMPVAFLAYCLGVLGMSVRAPLDAAAGADLAGGVLAELSGVDRLLVQAGRYALLVAGAAVAVPLFLGGGAGPLLPGWLWVVLKAGALAWALAAVGSRLPTLRPDRVLQPAWVVLLPLVLLQDLVVAAVVVWG